jgi:CRISPR-associated protein Csb1
VVEGFYEELRAAVALEGDCAVLRLVASYEPVGGPGSRVFPPTYPRVRDESPYLIEERWVEGEARRDVLLDGTASQANRVEEALLRARRAGEVECPLMELRHAGETEVVLSSLEWPHRYADAYARDSLLDGVAFDRSPLGKSLRTASLADARPLFTADPGSLVFGAWDSHRQGRQQKFPRVYSSELIGWDPVEASRKAGRMDPLNLQGAAKRGKDSQDWEFAAVSQKNKGEKLSEIGHGNVAPNSQHGGVTISSAQRFATVSLAGLDRIGFGDLSRPAAVAARVVLAAYALAGDRLAFGGPSLWLRSGCELVLASERLEWVQRGGQCVSAELTRADALELLSLAVKRAAEQGVSWNSETVSLVPTPSLAKAIDFSLTKAAPEAGAE